MTSVFSFFLKNRITDLAIGAFLFTLTLDPDWNSKGLIFMVIVSFFYIKPEKLYCKKYLFMLLLTVAYIAVNMVFISKKIDFSCFKTPGLCVLFLLLIFQMRRTFGNIKKITLFFSFGVLATGIVNLFNFFIWNNSYLLFDSWTEYTLIDIHKIYYGAFVNLSFLMLFYLNIKKQITNNILLIITSLFAVLLIFTGSVSNLFIFVLVSFMCLLYKHCPSIYKTFYLLLIITPFLLLFSLTTPYGKKLFEEIEGEKSRVRNFEINKSLIIKSPILGNGIGMELLSMQTARNKKSWEYLNKYNAHNQYFQYLIGGGAVYLFFSIFPVLYINIKDKKLNQNLLANGFTLILSYIFLIESFEERHHGQMFYAFFVSLIIYEMNKDKLNESY